MNNLYPTKGLDKFRFVEMSDMYLLGGTYLGSVPFGRTYTSRRKLHIACDDFFMLRIKSHLALISLLLLSAKSPARLACSLASALTTARFRYQLFAVFTRVQLRPPKTRNIFFIAHRQKAGIRKDARFLVPRLRRG